MKKNKFFYGLATIFFVGVVALNVSITFDDEASYNVSLEQLESLATEAKAKKVTKATPKDGPPTPFDVTCFSITTTNGSNAANNNGGNWNANGGVNYGGVQLGGGYNSGSTNNATSSSETTTSGSISERKGYDCPKQSGACTPFHPCP